MGQSLNTSELKLSSVSRSAIVTSVKPVQPEKASSQIPFTEFGILMDVKPVQPLKASRSISVTELGISMDVKPVQPEKADKPIDVTAQVTPS